MIRTSRKVEVAAAAFYAGAFILWKLGDEYKLFEPEFGPGQDARTKFFYEMERARIISNWEATYLGLLLMAVSLTIAAIRVRKSSPED